MQKPQKFGVKNVKHIFTDTERKEFGMALANALADGRNLKTEFEGVKAEYKSREKVVSAKVSELETAVTNGFRMVHRDCVVVFDPEHRQKHFYLETDTKLQNCVATEPMTSEDFVTDLLAAESVFDERTEIDIISAREGEFAYLIVGKFGKQWYSAIRCQIGTKKMEERLDSEQPSYKKRIDAVTKALARFSKWVEKSFDKDAAKGFETAISDIIVGEKDK